MNFAWPWDEVVNGIYGELGRHPKGPVPPEIQGHDPNTFEYTTDLDQAKTLLATAGVAEGTKLTMALESGLEGPKAAAQLFQQNLAQLGIDLEVEEWDLSTYTGMIYGDAGPEDRPNFMWWGWWPDYNDAWNHLYPQVSCDAQGSAGSNMGFYCNDKVQELLDTAKNAPDQDTYMKAISEIQEILSKDDPPSIYYIEPAWVVLLPERYRRDLYQPGQYRHLRLLGHEPQSRRVARGTQNEVGRLFWSTHFLFPHDACYVRLMNCQMSPRSERSKRLRLALSSCNRR